MTNQILAGRRSLCPICLTQLDAAVVQRGEDVFLEKTCPEHGFFSTIIWRGDTPSWTNWNSPDEPHSPPKHHTQKEKGCPLDCGLCPDHTAHTCTILFEVTERCNLGCPVCFAHSGELSVPDIALGQVKKVFQGIIAAGGPYPLQLSGGEPTVRDDLPKIVALAKELGFPHVQINTNGLRIAENISYLHSLKEAGTDLIYLQMDGTDDGVYRQIRGRALADVKRKALENCTAVRIGVQLVPTMIRGVNDHQLGAIVELAKEFMPTVKGIHFQPVSYFGRFLPMPSNETRMTIPDVLHGLEVQTGGELKAEHYLPRRKHDAHCGFSAFYILGEDGVLRSATHFYPAKPASKRSEMTPAEHVRKFITSHSRFIEDDPSECECMRTARLNKALARAQKYSLSISGMPFMDAWTIDLERLKNCCVHVARPDGRIIPFCANYLTNREGVKLYD
ncbi:radical SAM protein [Dehalobacter sp. DCM]|uniref:radical SAM (seleno)protein TrsS n=1 Tax=Dehalobacter sp. DCM TaxID=2907827 RepID=UPI003081271B|nr:radical SAM protein [Dehalobacter sp. DCM]